MFSIWYLLVMLFLFFVPMLAVKIGRAIAVRKAENAREGYYYGFCCLLVSIIAAFSCCIGVCVAELQEPAANLPIIAVTLLTFGYMAFLRWFLQRNMSNKQN